MAPAPERPGFRERAEQTRLRLLASESGRLLLRAIEAHGGLEAWYQAPTSSYTWEYSNHLVNLRVKSHLVADNRTRRVYHELLTLGTPEEPKEISGRLAWDGEKAWITPPTIGSSHGDGDINARFWAQTPFYFESIPFVLADPGVSYKVWPPEALDGVEHDRVMAYYDAGVGDSSGDTFTLYVDRDTGRVSAILYTVTYGRETDAGRSGPTLPERGILFYYENYTNVDGLTVATHFRGYRYNGEEREEQSSEAWVSDISFRRPFDESKLVMPPDARIQPYGPLRRRR